MKTKEKRSLINLIKLICKRTPILHGKVENGILSFTSVMMSIETKCDLENGIYLKNDIISYLKNDNVKPNPLDANSNENDFEIENLKINDNDKVILSIDNITLYGIISGSYYNKSKLSDYRKWFIDNNNIVYFNNHSLTAISHNKKLNIESKCLGDIEIFKYLLPSKLEMTNNIAKISNSIYNIYIKIHDNNKFPDYNKIILPLNDNTITLIDPEFCITKLDLILKKIKPYVNTDKYSDKCINFLVRDNYLFVSPETIDTTDTIPAYKMKLHSVHNKDMEFNINYEIISCLTKKLSSTGQSYQFFTGYDRSQFYFYQDFSRIISSTFMGIIKDKKLSINKLNNIHNNAIEI